MTNALFRTETDVISCSRPLYRVLYRARSSVAAASWAVTGEPSENRALLRRWMVHTMRPPSYSQLSASRPTGRYRSSSAKSPSYSSAPTVCCTGSVADTGSRLSPAI